MGGFYWIASYPKSGNTWVRLLLANLLEEDGALDYSEPIGFASVAASSTSLELYLDVEASDLTPAEQAELRHDLCLVLAHETSAPLFRKVHDGWGVTPSGRPLFPPQVTLGTIYIVRDPRDVAVSWAHHSGLTLDEAIAFLADPNTAIAKATRWNEQFEQRLGSWSDHVASWLGAQPAPLLVSYERLSTDTVAVLAQIADFCQIPASAARIEAAVKAARFDRLQQAEKIRRFEMGQRAGRNFFRRGVAGGWRDTLSSLQADRIIQDHQEAMKRLGYL